MPATFHAAFCAPGEGLRPVQRNHFQQCFATSLGLLMDVFLFALASVRYARIRGLESGRFERSPRWRVTHACAATVAAMHPVLLLTDSVMADDMYVSQVLGRVVTGLAWVALTLVLRVELSRGLAPGSDSFRAASGVTCALAFLEMLTRRSPATLVLPFLPLFAAHLALAVLAAMPRPEPPEPDDSDYLAFFADDPDRPLVSPLDGGSLNDSAGPSARRSAGSASGSGGGSGRRSSLQSGGGDGEVWSKLIQFQPSSAAATVAAATPPDGGGGGGYRAPTLSSVAAAVAGAEPSSPRHAANRLGLAVRVEDVALAGGARPEYSLRVRAHDEGRDGPLDGRSAALDVEIEDAADPAEGKLLRRTWDDLEQLYGELQSGEPGAAGGGRGRVVLPPLPGRRVRNSPRSVARVRREANSFLDALLQQSCAESEPMQRFLGVRCSPAVAAAGAAEAAGGGGGGGGGGSGGGGGDDDEAGTVPAGSPPAARAAPPAAATTPGAGGAAVSVPRWEVAEAADGSGKEHVNYVVETWAGGRRHVERRRFREFVALDGELGSRFSGGVRPELPPRRLRFDKRNARDVEERRAALEAYLEALLASNFRGVPEVEQFLGAPGQLGAHQLPRRMRVTVPDFCEDGDHVAYRVVTTVPDEAGPDLVFETTHRYSDFPSLHASCRRMPCPLPLPSPPGRLLGGGSGAERALERRRAALEAYLQTLVLRVGQSREVQWFLAVSLE